MSRKPRFRVGQVVFWSGDNEWYPFKIQHRFLKDGVWNYDSGDGPHLESELRPLTAREIGPSRKAGKGSTRMGRRWGNTAIRRAQTRKNRDAAKSEPLG